jgi:hypothetical protein
MFNLTNLKVNVAAAAFALIVPSVIATASLAGESRGSTETRGGTCFDLFSLPQNGGRSSSGIKLSSDDNQAKTTEASESAYAAATRKEIKITRPLFPFDGTPAFFPENTGYMARPAARRTIELSRDGKVFHRIPLSWPLWGNVVNEAFLLRELEDSLQAAPNAWLKALSEIRINDIPHVRAMVSLGKSPSGSVTELSMDIFPPFWGNGDSFGDRLFRYDVMRHELGHVIMEAARRIPKFRNIDELWAEAMTLDGMSVTTYADTNHLEDFAETAKFYAKNMGTYRKHRDKFPHRYALLDQITEELASQ